MAKKKVDPKKNGNAGKFATKQTTSTHKLNVPVKVSEMSEADKATLRAWEYTYKHRANRVD